MQSSTTRILTTHCGSLPRPDDLTEPLYAKDARKPYDRAALDARVAQSVKDVVRKQLDLDIDIVTDGEHSKSSFATYARARISGLEESPKPAAYRGTTRDQLAFPAVYDDLRRMNAARNSAPRSYAMTPLVCTGEVKYRGQADVAADIANLRAALRDSPQTEAFVTAISPTNLQMYFANEFYAREDDYLTALCDAMREEYRAIIDAGFLLQIDDPRLATHYNRTPGASIEDCRKFIAHSVEALNYTLKGIPRDRVRFHTCYSVNVAPRVHDLELKHFVDLMLQIEADAFSIEASNPRHEHEWQVFEHVKLPPGRILVPGVVTHCDTLVEHPELVAQRIIRFAGVIGAHNVIASNDCGFATSAAGDQVHADVAWAKLASLVEGARIASKQLWS
jgi:5-methyltetrahydropteroyltriglutamate--homocysteine methyltransferase